MLYIPHLIINEIEKNFDRDMQNLIQDYTRELADLDWYKRTRYDAFCHEREQLLRARAYDLGISEEA